MEQKNPRHNDAWISILGEQRTEKGLRMDEPNAKSAMIPLAGEPSTVILTGIMSHPLATPARYAELTEEIWTTFSESRDIMVETVSGRHILMP